MTANPYRNLAAAAGGDVGAQRALAQMSVDALCNPDVDREATLREGLVFARMAAAHPTGATDGDAARVISMLALHARYSPDSEQSIILGEAFARYSALVARGVEVEGVDFDDLIAHAPPEIVTCALNVQDAMREGLEA